MPALTENHSDPIHKEDPKRKGIAQHNE